MVTVIPLTGTPALARAIFRNIAFIQTSKTHEYDVYLSPDNW